MLQIIVADNDYDNPSIVEDASDYAEQIRLETGLHGGMLSLTFKLGLSLEDSFRWYKSYITNRMLAIDEDHRLVFDGRLEDVKKEPGQIEVVAVGPWAHMADQFYQDLSSWLATGDAKTIIEDMITNKCLNISTDYEYIEDTNFDVYPIIFKNYERPRQIVAHLASLGDDQTPPREWYFAVWPAPMNGPIPNRPIAHFFPKPTTTVDWYITLADLTTGQQALSLTRSSKQLYNKVASIYSDSVGSRAVTSWAEDTDSQSDWGGIREGLLSIGGATATTAAGARDQFLQESHDPQQSSTILLDGVVYDSAYRPHNLWEVRAGDVIRITDLVPTDVSFASDKLDALRTFFIKETRYTADNNRLAISPDYNAPGLDILLARAGLSGGKGI